MFFSRITNRINTKLLLINLIGIILVTALLTVFSASMINSVFRKRYEDKLQTPGRIFLAQYTYKDILPYIDKMKERIHLIAESEQYLQDRQYVLDMEQEQNHAGLAYPDEYYDAKNRIEVYVDTLSELKDDKYYAIKNRMLQMRVGAGLTYFYIFADLGIPDLYITIFDAVFQGDATSSFGEDYGTPNLKSYYKEAEEVFKTGDSVIALNNARDSRNEKSYYSLMPVKDEYGEVIAIIGTDINMQSLETQLRSFLITSVSMIMLLSLALMFTMYFTLRGLVIKPIQKLTAISSDIAAGNINGEIPDWIIERKDEMGILGMSYKLMGEVLRDMLSKNDALFEAAMSGRLNIRSDPSSLSGLFAQVTSKINDTLDVIGSYFDSIPSSLAILNSEYDIVFTNNQFDQTFKDVTDKMIYQTMLEAGDGENKNTLKEKLAAKLEQKEFSALVWFDLPNLPDGRRCLSFLCSQVTRDGNINGAILVATDATEMVLAKDRALSANKAKSEFLSRVSHELRTPLNVILSMAKLGLNDKKLEESMERFGKIVTSSSHLSNIINDVLEMSRMESGKTEIKLEQMNLRKAAEECVELLSLRAEENKISLVLSIDPNLPELLAGDEFRIRQILINLLSNAVKFTAEGRVSLDIAVRERGENTCVVLFTVTDTGIGMSEEFLKKIFTPFEQEDSFLSRRYEGSGLGLSISYNLTALMGGDMTVESELGKGSRFMFSIPFDIIERIEPAGEETNKKAAETVKISLRGKRILIVDDIEINRLIVFELLENTGADFDEAGDGKEAYEKFMQSPVNYYDCILMDIQMPEMDGYTATGAIRASGRADHTVPIIAMTANALKEDIERAAAAGMSDHIAKPLDFNICLMKLKQWCNL